MTTTPQQLLEEIRNTREEARSDIGLGLTLLERDVLIDEMKLNTTDTVLAKALTDAESEREELLSEAASQEESS